jgi:hypothetical protein
MEIPQAARDKRFHFLPNQLVSVIAKQRAQLSVDHENPAAFVHHGDAVGRRLQEFPEIEEYYP